MSFKNLPLLFLLMMFSVTSFAADFYTATTALNVRINEGTEYAVSFTLKTGDEVEVLSKSNDWYKITHLNRVGYVSPKYLKFSRTVPEQDSPGRKQTRFYLLIGICICPLAFVIFQLVRSVRDNRLLKTVTTLNRGEWSERNLVLRLLKFGLPAYALFHDLLVETSKNNFAQIDLVAVTDVGVLVFEVKDYSGWIYGDGKRSQWTKVLAYGREKYRFYNPIMQNNKHVAEAKRHLQQIGHIPFYSIIVFYGNCVLKEINFVPEGTFLVKSGVVLDVVKDILEKNQRVNYKNVSEVLQVFERAVTNGGILENQLRHKENIRNMPGNNRIYD